MKSRITIEVDFERGNQPFIQILEHPLSLDVRDKLITSFRQDLGYSSSWLRVDFPPHKNSPDGEFIGMNIYPIKPHELLEAAKQMELRSQQKTD